MEQEQVGAAEHEWIENQSDFEGVLVCTNDLRDWDESAVVRAFQTFEWNDASTPGNDACFVHIETGVIVRHDGGVLAIEFGQGKLGSALPDLFMVLHQIGWRSADLYHAPETMNLLLMDMGRAIPASMDLDVQAAKAGRVVSEFAEGAAMIARGRQILAGGMDDVNRVLMEEMESLNVGVQVAQPVQSQVPRPIVLIDDDDDDGGGEMVMVRGHDGGQASVAVVAAQVINVAASPVGDDSYNEQPQTFVLPADSGEQSAASLLDVNESQADVAVGVLDRLDIDPRSDAGADSLAASDVGVDAESVHSPEALVAEVTTALAVGRNDVVREQSRHCMGEGRRGASGANSRSVRGVLDSAEETPLSKIVQVGLSAFCFDYPANPVSSDDVLAIADECGVGVGDVVHLHPGAIEGAIRWDVLGEIAAEYPWFAEKIVAAMLVESGDCSLVASIILALKEHKSDAQLRDVLMFAYTCEADMARAVADLLPAAGGLIVHAGACGYLTPTMDEVVRRLGSLVLAPAGASFVDLPAAGVVGAQRVLTVRGVAQSPHAEVFVVHVDYMDGPFVLWLVELLRFVVSNYAATKRYACEVAGVEDVGAAELASESGELAQARDMMAQLAIVFAKLEKK